MLFEILDRDVTNEDVIRATYSSFNPIEYYKESSLDEMILNINDTLSVTRRFWADQWIAEMLEK